MLESIYMEIKYLKEKTIFLKGKKESILINPNNDLFSDSKCSARIILYTNENDKQADLQNEKILINGPGEYEVGGIEINGINGENGNTVYKLVIDGFKIVVVGELAQELNEKRIEKIEETDILIVSPKIADKVNYKIFKNWAKKWGANYLIPITSEKQVLDEFLDETDFEGLESMDGLKIEKIDELPDGLELKLLKSIN